MVGQAVALEIQTPQLAELVFLVKVLLAVTML
jgi:hypothetical protein